MDKYYMLYNGLNAKVSLIYRCLLPRLEGKHSLLPKMRTSGSVDRLSSELRRPSAVRSSSAEPPRGTVGIGRLSREASASKIPINRVNNQSKKMYYCTLNASVPY